VDIRKRYSRVDGVDIFFILGNRNRGTVGKTTQLHIRGAGMIKKFFGRLACLTGHHDWTCAVDEGQDKPTQKQIDDGIEGFYDYAKMYCKRCPKIYSPRN